MVVRNVAKMVMFFVDNLVRIIGPIFVAAVWVLVSGIVWGWYAVLRPYLLRDGLAYTAVHFLIAHWLLVNIMYNYFKGTRMSPGAPPKVHEAVFERALQENYKVCKKCKTIKPSRAHHCTVCKTCVLGMDHHCPWFNNCVGHMNHRHFFLFMAYMWVGVLYIVSVSYGPYSARAALRQEMRREGRMRDFRDELVNRGLPLNSGQLSFLFILCSAVAVSLGILLFWHVFLVSTAQTTIEFYKHLAERGQARRRGEVWRGNPHDQGVVRNWQVFLGISGTKDLGRVLFPSGHGPVGDGLHWEHLKQGNHPILKTAVV